VGHHVALVVGSARLLETAYFRGKITLENLIKSSQSPLDCSRYAVLRIDQRHRRFFHRRNTVRLPPTLIEPIAAEDVAGAARRIALGSPLNGTVEITGPEKFRLYELVRRGLAAPRIRAR